VPQTSARPAPPTASAVPESPAARRLTLHRWRDPRLWVGLVLVAASVLVGSRLLATADDTVGVWAAAHDVAAGTPLTADALVVRRVRFADAAAASAYLPASRPPAPGAVLDRDVAAGELLPRSAVGAADAAAFELPVVVSAAGAPDDLATGDVVDVWVAPPVGSPTARPAVRVLDAVPVVGTTRSSGPLGDAATRQVLLGLGKDAADGAGELDAVLGRIATGSVVLVRHGGGR
jgi:hypothetical protein